MRLPFLRSNRRETGAAPPQDPAPATPKADAAPPAPRHAALSSQGEGRTVSFPLDVVFANIPERLRGAVPSGGAQPATVDLPGIEVLSQVSRGEVVFALRTLLPLLPDECVKRPLPKPLTDFVRLPLDEVVSRIPADWLELRADQEILDPPDDLPDLFGETSSAGEGAVAVTEEASADAAAALERAGMGADAGPGDDAADVAIAAAQASRPASSPPAIDASAPPAAEIQGHVRVRLVRLLDALPSGVVATADPKAVEEADLEFQLADIMPQLARGEVVVPLRKVAEALPASLRADEPRNLPIQPVSLPLAEIVSQIPASLFAMATGQVALPMPGEQEIPIPFRESTQQSAVRAPEPGGRTMLPDSMEPEIVECPAPAPDESPLAAEAKPPAPAPTRADQGQTAAPAERGAMPPAPVAMQPVAGPIPPPAVEESPAAEAPPIPVGDLPQAPLDLSAWPRQAAAAALGRSIDGLDINRCRAEDLLDLPGIGPSMAARIVRFREEHGPIRSLYQLLDVPGIGRRLFERITGLSATEAGMPLVADLGRLLGLPPNRSPRLREIGAGCERLPGVDAAAFASRDGLVITGRAGEGMDLDRVAACAPMLLRRISRYTREAGWGKVRAFSVFADPKSLTVFATRQLMLLVAHDPGSLSAETIARLNSVAEISERSCSRRLILEDHRPWQ